MDEFEELEFYSHTTTLLFHYLFDASSTPKNISEPFLDFLNEYLSGFDSLPIATLTKQETGNIRIRPMIPRGVRVLM